MANVAKHRVSGKASKAKPDRVVPILLEFLLDEDEEIVYAAMRGLTLIGPQENIMKTLVALLRDQRQGVRTYAGWQLRELGSAVVPVLVKALGDKDSELRSRVAWTLGGMRDRQAEGAMDALQTATKDSNEDVRTWAAWALERINEQSR